MYGRGPVVLGKEEGWRDAFSGFVDQCPVSGSDEDRRGRELPGIVGVSGKQIGFRNADL